MIREIELRVTRRAAEEASTPAYQASTTVRSRPKARIATATASTVSELRSGWRRALRSRILRTIIRSRPCPGGGRGARARRPAGRG